MMKILGCILIFIGSTCIGTLKAATYRDRRAELEDTLELIRLLQMEITYRKDSLQKSFMKTASLKDCWFSQLLKGCCEELSNNESLVKAWEISLNKNMQNCPLYHSDLVIIKDISMGIGRSDIEGQKKVFEPALIRIQSALSESKEMERRQGRMYRSLGISVGILIFILFI